MVAACCVVMLSSVYSGEHLWLMLLSNVRICSLGSILAAFSQ